MLYKNENSTSDLSLRLLGIAIVTAPKLSFRVLEMLIGIIVLWFLTEF